MAPETGADPRRRLPSVDKALQRPRLRALVVGHGRAAVVAAVRDVLAGLRQRADEAGPAPLDELDAEVAARLALAGRPSLRRVINATGVVVHTNLGRAPLSTGAAARLAEIAGGYSNLEYDLDSGARAGREQHAESRLLSLLGVEAAVVVNNCAAAVLLAVNTLAEGREVIVSRGELVEIGGSFRIPDVLRKGGARLKEVGTTNRTRLADYRAALSSETALILKVHPSNFRLVGFTEQASLAQLAELARETGVPLLEDQGNGALDRLPGPLAAESTVRRSLEEGAHVVAFSGDKLLGGPQAGLLVGRAAFVDAMRRNPLYRALRVDKLTVAALDATLVEHELGRAGERVPVLRMLAESAASLGSRAAALARELAREAPGLRPMVVEAESTTGGGAAPTVGLPTLALSLDPGPAGADDLAARLRAASPPVVARVADDRLVLDLRTVATDEEPLLLSAVLQAARVR